MMPLEQLARVIGRLFVARWLGPRQRPEVPNHGLEMSALALDARRRLWARWAAGHALQGDDYGEQFRGRLASFDVAVDARAVKGWAQPVVVIAEGPSPFVATVWWKRAGREVVQAFGAPPHQGVQDAMRALFEGAPDLVSYRWDSGHTTLRFAPTTDPFAVDTCLDGLEDLLHAAADAYR